MVSDPDLVPRAEIILEKGRPRQVLSAAKSTTYTWGGGGDRTSARHSCTVDSPRHFLWAQLQRPQEITTRGIGRTGRATNEMLAPLGAKACFGVRPYRRLPAQWTSVVRRARA